MRRTVTRLSENTGVSSAPRAHHISSLPCGRRMSSYATFESLPGGWDQFPGLGALWCRVPEHVEEARIVIRRPCW